MDFALPPVGEGLIEVELTRWLVAPGDSVVRGQALAEVMSDKASMEVPAPFAGTVTEVLGQPGDKLPVGAVILRYTPAADLGTRNSDRGTLSAEPRPTGDRPPPAPPSSEFRVPSSEFRVPAAAPSVRLLARKLGVDLAAVRGSGPAGRVLVEDLAPHVAPPPAGKPPSSAIRVPSSEFGTPGTRVKLVGLRRAIAEQMVRAKQAPHFTYVDEFDLTELVRLRAQLKEPFAAAGVKLTVLPFIVKAVARALKDVPVVNSTFDAAADEQVLHAGVHVGVAVAAPAGLVVPVVRDADKRDVAGVAAEIDRLATAARAGKLARADLGGGTFTVSSIGGIGGLIATPILNAPEVGIVAVGKVVRRPVYDDRGAVGPADVAYFSFSFDHRFIDGAVAAHFGNAVGRHLARPAALLLAEGFKG